MPRRVAGPVMVFSELSPPYSTIVADPPWRFEQGGPHSLTGAEKAVRTPPYSMMRAGDIAALPVESLAAADAHLFLWTTNAHLRSAYGVAEEWGVRSSQLLTWCKSPHGLGPGGAFANTTEFVLYCRRGSLGVRRRMDTTWWHWPRGRHSEKPPAFLDIVEEVSPGPYVELFCREPRFGWDSWGYGYEGERVR